MIRLDEKAKVIVQVQWFSRSQFCHYLVFVAVYFERVFTLTKIDFLQKT